MARVGWLVVGESNVSGELLEGKGLKRAQLRNIRWERAARAQGAREARVTASGAAEVAREN
jgi:hypothetical protein